MCAKLTWNKTIVFILVLCCVANFSEYAMGQDETYLTSTITAFKTGEKFYNSGKYSTALPYLRQAANDGHTNAMDYLGYMYLKGLGVQQDYHESLKIYRQAVDNGYSLAMSNIGDFYRKGLGVPQNYKEALYWYQRGTELNDAACMANLGYMYEKGLGVERDIGKAHQLYLKAASYGNKWAEDRIKSILN